MGLLVVALLLLASTVCTQSFILMTNDDRPTLEPQTTPPPSKEEGPVSDSEASADASSVPEPASEETTASQPADRGRKDAEPSESGEQPSHGTLDTPTTEDETGSQRDTGGRYAPIEDEALLEEEEDKMVARTVEDHDTSVSPPVRDTASPLATDTASPPPARDTTSPPPARDTVSPPERDTASPPARDTVSPPAGDTDGLPSDLTEGRELVFEETAADDKEGKSEFESPPVGRGEDEPVTTTGDLGRDLPLHDELSEGTLMEQAVGDASHDIAYSLEEDTETLPPPPTADEPLPLEEPRGDGFQLEPPSTEGSGPRVSAPEGELGTREEGLGGEEREDQDGTEEEGEVEQGEGPEEAPTPEPDEDVPTFEEFKQRKLLEQEALQGPADAHTGGHNTRLPISGALNNYASPDCGAKVIAANPEARNTMAVLLENKDVYMINPCSASIWFVVELCELVSVRTLEIACFELFSSNPESFNVYSTDSYPEGEWSHLGTFHVNNEREVQSLPLVTDTEQSVYSKYIKVEMLSHFGSEHYCPLSLLRVLGASMMEVFEYSERQEQSGRSIVLPPSEEGIMDELLSEVGEESVQRNGTLLSAAKDAVLSLLDKVNGFIKPEVGEGEGGGGGCEGRDTPCQVAEELQGGNTLERNESTLSETGIDEDQGVTAKNSGDLSSTASPDRPISSEEDSPHSQRPEPTPPPEEERGGTEHDQQGTVDQSSLQNSAPNQQNPVPNQQNPVPNLQNPVPNLQNSVPNLEASPQAEELPPVEMDAGLHGNIVGVPDDVTADGRPSDVIPEEPGRSDGASLRELHERNLDSFVDDSHSSSSPMPQPTAADSSPSHRDHSSDSTELPQQPAATSEESGSAERPSDTAGTSSEDTAAEKQDLHAQTDAVRPPGLDTESPGLSLGTDLEQTSSEPSGETLRGPAGTGGEGPAEESGREVSGVPEGETPPDETGGDHGDGTTVSSAEAESTTNGVDVDTHTTDSEDSATVAQLPPSPPSPSPATALPPSPATAPSPTSSPPSPDDTNSSQEPVAADGGLPTEPPISTEHTHPDTKPSLNASTSLSQHNTTAAPHNKTAADSLPSPSNGLGLPGGGTAQPKEKSVFIRLSNRIKDLEENMSLFSSYLEEIRTQLKKNKNRTEDAQKSLDRRVSQLNDSLQTLRHEAEQSLSFLRSLYSELQEIVSLMRHIVVDIEALPNKEISVWHILLAAAAQASVLLLLLLLLCAWLRHKHSSLSTQLLALRTDIGRVTSNSRGHVTQTGNHVTNHMGGAGPCSANHIAGSISRNELTCTKQDSQRSAQTMSGLLSNPSHSSLSGTDQDSWQVADGRKRRKKSKDKSL